MASYRRHDHLKPSRRISGLGFLSIVVIIAIIAPVSLTFSRWEAQPPEVKFDANSKAWVRIRRFESHGCRCRVRAR
jgi:hypothetical protein